MGGPEAETELTVRNRTMVQANSLVELRLRAGDIQLSRGRTAFVANPTGVVLDDPHHGLFVY